MADLVEPTTPVCDAGCTPSPTAAVAVVAEHRERCRAAAALAREVYLGATGELIERELRAYADFGYRFDADRLLPLLAADVLAAAMRAGSPGASS